MALILRSLFGWMLFMGAPAAPDQVAMPGHDVQADSPVICVRKIDWSLSNFFKQN